MKLLQKLPAAPITLGCCLCIPHIMEIFYLTETSCSFIYLCKHKGCSSRCCTGCFIASISNQEIHRGIPKLFISDHAKCFIGPELKKIEILRYYLEIYFRIISLVGRLLGMCNMVRHRKLRPRYPNILRKIWKMGVTW